MKKSRYIIPTIVVTELNAKTELMGTSLENHAGGISTKERDSIEEEEEMPADYGQLKNYSLW